MDKEYIIREIKRTAEENGGKPLGQIRFARDTGIKNYDWQAYWVKWSDTLKEAGFAPISWNQPYLEEYLLQKMISLIREKGYFPTKREIALRNRGDDAFPSRTAFLRRLGRKHEKARKIVEYCKKHGGLSDVVDICLPIIQSKVRKDVKIETKSDDDVFGYVYLMKSGKYYKIGRSSSPGRREYELDIKLPEKVELVHQIKTDDPEGIEQYWHNRFKEKHKRGEWFLLSRKDISAFKRRKFM